MAKDELSAGRSGRDITALDRILELVVVLDDDMTSRFARDGLTRSRVHLLWELEQLGGGATQRALADALDVSARNVTGLVDALVETGFVTRQPHPTDRRATLVSFTDLGASVVSEMQRDRLDLAHALFAEMDDERLEAFVDALDDVLAVVRHQLEIEAGRVGDE